MTEKNSKKGGFVIEEDIGENIQTTGPRAQRYDESHHFSSRDWLRTQTDTNERVSIFSQEAKEEEDPKNSS